MAREKGTWRISEVVVDSWLLCYIFFFKCWNSHISLKPPAFISGSSVISRCTNMRHDGVEFHPHNGAAREWCHCISTVLWCVQCAYVFVYLCVCICILSLCLQREQLQPWPTQSSHIGTVWQGTHQIKCLSVNLLFTQLNLLSEQYSHSNFKYNLMSVYCAFVRATFSPRWDLST